MDFIKTTEEESFYDDLEKMDLNSILTAINKEDASVSNAVFESLYQIEKVTAVAVDKLRQGGRLFYIGAGTSGRLGILDASECPPTFGVNPNLVIGIIAGGDTAIRSAVEFAEDDDKQGWKDLNKFQINSKDFVIGIAASGTTPYVLGALKDCNTNNIITACICCNKKSPLAEQAKYPIEVVVGPEFVTGSSRMKAGTAQKMILNMISTACMIQLGKVKGNKMVDMQLSNKKLQKRAIKMIIHQINVSEAKAIQLLECHQSVRRAIQAYQNG